MDLQRLYTRVEIKAVDTAQRLIEGFAAAFDNKDRVGDIIESGAFTRTLKENDDVLCFIGHDSSRLPIGEPVAMRSETKGLFTRTRVYNTPAGDELLEVAQQRLNSGKTLGMSIGYRTVKQRYEGGARHLLDVDLLEYSFLASPALAANPEATVTGMKKRGRKATGIGPVITTEDSYEDLREDLAQAAAVTLEVYGVSVCATFSDHVVVSAYMNGDVQFWDIPYTLDADGEPVLGDPSEVDPAFVPADVKARAALPENRPPTPTPERKVNVKDLDDSAFAFIEAGTTLDEERKSVPRAARHFPHHTEHGEIDIEGLKSALADSDLHKHGPVAVAHLMRHARAAGLLGEKSVRDDAHDREWSDGAAPRLFVLATQLIELAESVVGDQKAMERLGIETKSGDRLYAAMQTQLKALHTAFGHILDQAESVDRGEDGTAQLEVFRRAFEFLDLEEVA